MKKIILFAATVLLFVACKKSVSNTPVPINTIEANINGANYTFNKNTHDTILFLATFDFIPYLSLRASADTGANAKAFEIDLVSDNFDSTKNYSPVNSPYNNDVGYLDYFQDTIHAYWDDQLNSTTNPVTITITSVTPSTIQGTFKGDMFLSGYNDSTKVTVSGRFNFNK